MYEYEWSFEVFLEYFLMMWDLQIIDAIEEEIDIDCSIIDYLEDE